MKTKVLARKKLKNGTVMVQVYLKDAAKAIGIKYYGPKNYRIWAFEQVAPLYIGIKKYE